MKPRFTDGRGKYHGAAESREPGYLARRLKAYARLTRMKAARGASGTNVQNLQKRKAA